MKPTDHYIRGWRVLLMVFWICSSAHALMEERLVFSIDIIRHGDRNPTVDFPKDPRVWPEGLGELTTLGMQQTHALGQSLRKKYVDHYHLLPPVYRAETLYVRSTDFNRTLMSAQYVLAGLYPSRPGFYCQPIPIHTVPKQQDDLLLSFDLNLKKIAWKAISTFYSAPCWRSALNDISQQFPRWSQLTGYPLHHFLDFISFGDHLHIRVLHHQPLPPGITLDEFRRIKRLFNDLLVNLFRIPEVGHWSGSLLSQEIDRYFEKAIHATEDPLKYVLFSAHDTTLEGLLSALHAPLSEPPPYASLLNFSLFKTVAGTYEVEVSFNGKPYALSECGHTSRCSMAEWKKLLSH